MFGPVITALKAGAMKKDEDVDNEEEMLLIELEVEVLEGVDGAAPLGGGGGGGGGALLEAAGGGGGGGGGGGAELAAAGLGLSND